MAAKTEKSKRKSYPDLRWMFIRGLISYEKFQRTKHWLKSAAEWTSRAIVSLDLAELPVKSVKQASQLEGIGGEICKKLKEVIENGKVKADPPKPGTHATSASAILVALFDLTQESHCKDGLVEEKLLKEAVAQTCCENIRDDDSSGVCPAWLRMNILISRGFVKRRSLKKSPVYELLDLGRELASRLKDKNALEERKLIIDGEGRNLPANQIKANEALYTNDQGKDGVILLVDTKELGGDRVGLNQLCQSLEQAGLCLQSRNLKYGDYQWLWRKGNCETILPVLVERKRADDLAHSLTDGRYERQRTKMLAWKETFSTRQQVVSLKYIVESEPELYMVKCLDGCRGVGRCGGPSVEQVQAVISDLATDQNFDLLQTENLTETIRLLAAITSELTKRASDGDFEDLAHQATYTNTTRCVSKDRKPVGEGKQGGEKKKRAAKGPTKQKVKKVKLENVKHTPDKVTECNNGSISCSGIKVEKEVCFSTDVGLVSTKYSNSNGVSEALRVNCKQDDKTQVRPGQGKKQLPTNETCSVGMTGISGSYTTKTLDTLNCDNMLDSKPPRKVLNLKKMNNEDVNKSLEHVEPSTSQVPSTGNVFISKSGLQDTVDDAFSSSLPSLTRQPRKYNKELGTTSGDDPRKSSKALPYLDLEELLPSSSVIHDSTSSLTSKLFSTDKTIAWSTKSDSYSSSSTEKYNMDIELQDLTPDTIDTDPLKNSVGFVREVLPHVDTKSIKDMLQLFDGNVEQTIAYLLEH